MLFLNGIALLTIVASGLLLMLGAQHLALRLFTFGLLLAVVAPALSYLFGGGK